MTRHFSAGDVFAVSATSLDWDGQVSTWGPVTLKSHHGHYYWNPECSNQTRAYTLFASGGFMAVDRKKFLQLGGFNRLFHPAYCEDLDLCFRSWRRGWKTIYEPQSVVLHREHGTWQCDANDHTRRLMHRSNLLFKWSSLPDKGISLEKIGFLLKSIILACIRGDLWFFLGCFDAIFAWICRNKICEINKVNASELQKINEAIAKPL